jgi:hypothetical protein
MTDADDRSVQSTGPDPAPYVTAPEQSLAELRRILFLFAHGTLPLVNGRS